jgi:sortase (surface protein transpeptidase)
MSDLLLTVRSRLLPAVLTALGVVLLTAGLLSYADPTMVGAETDASPTTDVVVPSQEPSLVPSAPPTADPSATATAGPSESSSPDPTASGEAAVATRVVIPALGIDLPIVRGPDGYPLCNVAMYLKELGQPGEGRATYLYAHARDGMFGPIYRLAIQRHTPKKMLGMIVQVYTSDDKLYLYEITEYRLHAVGTAALEDALGATDEQLWLQTSEGPKGTPGKTQLIAELLSVGAADAKDAHPKAKPVACG